MLFILKNDEATYQHTISYIFHDYMHDIIEDYMDDLLAKYKTRDQYVEVLFKLFDILFDQTLRLYLKKYIFGVI